MLSSTCELLNLVLEKSVICWTFPILHSWMLIDRCLLRKLLSFFITTEGEVGVSFICGAFSLLDLVNSKATLCGHKFIVIFVIGILAADYGCLFWTVMWTATMVEETAIHWGSIAFTQLYCRLYIFLPTTHYQIPFFYLHYHLTHPSL